MATWRDVPVLVTGATGFVGAALAARLAAEGARVTGLGRRLERVPHLAEAGVALRAVDLLDAAGTAAALAGQQIVFHAAAWLGERHGDERQAFALNVTAVERLVEAAAGAGVGRLIHISSIAAYGPPRSAVVDEDTPVATDQADAYGRTKALGDLRARKLAATLGLPLVVTRPGMVYGPHSRPWTVRPLTLVQKGTPVLLGRGDGHAQPVYIDNYVDGLLLAATRPEAPGEAFTFVDRPLPWRDFFGYYAAMCGRRPRRLPLWLARALVAVTGALRLGPSVLRPEMLGYYTARSVYPWTRAERLLGYRPRVGIDEGMRRTEVWLRAHGYLPPATGQTWS